MIRTILQYGIPFLLPLAGYAAWIWYRNAYAHRHEGAPPKFEEGPWPAMLLLGAILMAASMAYTALTSGASPKATYIPPRVEGGKVIPGQLIEPSDTKAP